MKKKNEPHVSPSSFILHPSSFPQHALNAAKVAVILRRLETEDLRHQLVDVNIFERLGDVAAFEGRPAGDECRLHRLKTVIVAVRAAYLVKIGRLFGFFKTFS